MAAAASGSTAPRRPRRPVVAVLLALVVVLAGARPRRPRRPLPTPSWSPRPRCCRPSLDAQHAQIERMTERLNAIDEHRRTVQSSLAAARIRQRAAEAELAVAQRRLNDQARATYMQGPQWLLQELVGDSPDPLQRLPRQKAVLEAQAAVVDAVRARKAEVDALGRGLRWTWPRSNAFSRATPTNAARSRPWSPSCRLPGQDR